MSLEDCIRICWSHKFQFDEIKQLGIGREFVVFMSKSKNINYCIRVSLKTSINKILESETRKLEILQDHIKDYHEWIIPKYIDICDIYLPSASKPKLKSVIYECIGNQTVWDLGQPLVDFMNKQFENVGKFIATIHSFPINKFINTTDINIVTPKQQLSLLINEAKVRAPLIKKANVLNDNDLYDQCISFIDYCQDHIIDNTSKDKDIFGFTEFVEIGQDSKDNESDNDDCSIWNKYCLVHGDLHFAHFIIDDNDRNSIRGVIDWSDIRISDPASEFRYLWCMYGDWMDKSFYNKYRLKFAESGENEGKHWKQFHARCRVYGTLCCFLSIFWSLRQGESSNIWIERTRSFIPSNLKLIYQYINDQQC